MSDKNTLRAWTFFRQGIRIQGAHEFTPPSLTIVKTDLRTGAQDAPTPVDDGMEALTCQVKFYGLDTDMLASFGFVSGSRSRFTAYQGISATVLLAVLLRKLKGLFRLSRRMRGVRIIFLKMLSRSILRSVITDRRWMVVNCLPLIPSAFSRRVNGVDMLSGLAAKVRL